MGGDFWSGIVLGIVGIVILAVLIVAIWYVVCYNKFIRLRNDIEEADSNIDVYLRKRFDLVPNLVSTVKGYAKHEDEIFDRVTRARQEVLSAKDRAGRQSGEENLARSLQGLLAVAEAYPDLKASQNFAQLQAQLDGIESELAAARRYYNANVKMFNTMIQTWPSRIIAQKQGFGRQPLFEAEAAQRQNIHVEF